MEVSFMLDIAPGIGSIGLAAIIGCFLIFAAVAYVAFRLLRKTVRMAFRLAIVAAILLAALVGGILIYMNGTKPSPGPHPQPVRSR